MPVDYKEDAYTNCCNGEQSCFNHFPGECSDYLFAQFSHGCVHVNEERTKGTADDTQNYWCMYIVHPYYSLLKFAELKSTTSCQCQVTRSFVVEMIKQWEEVRADCCAKERSPNHTECPERWWFGQLVREQSSTNWGTEGSTDTSCNPCGHKLSLHYIVLVVLEYANWRFVNQQHCHTRANMSQRPLFPDTQRSNDTHGNTNTFDYECPPSYQHWNIYTIKISYKLRNTWSICSRTKFDSQEGGRASNDEAPAAQKQPTQKLCHGLVSLNFTSFNLHDWVDYAVSKLNKCAFNSLHNKCNQTCDETDQCITEPSP